MNVLARFAPSLKGAAGPESSPPRWERLLLAVDGTGDVDPTGEDDRSRPRSTRDWVVDVAMFGYAVLAAASILANWHGSIGTTLFAVDAAFAALACLSLWLRRRHPAGVAWLAVGLSTLSNAAVHAGQVAVFSAAIHARPRQAVQVTIAAVAAAAVVCAIYPGAYPEASGRGGFDWELFISWSALSVAAFTFGSFIRVRRQLVNRLRSEQELRVHDARLTERARIAREMHDVLAHRISLLSVHAGALEVSPDASQEEVARAASVIRISARAAQEELREVVGVLRTDPDGEAAQPPQPTIADLGQLIEESRHAGLDVTLADQLADQPLPTLAGRTAFRVVQEALTNARKHASGQSVAISIGGEPGACVEIDVMNRPASGERIGRQPDHVGSGTGLIGLAERLELAGGTLEHQALAGGGFRLSARIPWPATRGDSGDGEAGAS
jgi:signal transduction histidine kinase